MAKLPLLVNIAFALGYALLGGLLARRLGLPTIVGYLAAGVALGPSAVVFTGDADVIHQMAEFGVILLMFGVGLHFSFRDLWQVRRIAITGGLLQMVLVTAVVFAIARWWGFSPAGAWIFGMAIAAASTVVQTRSLMDNGWLETPHGRIAIGWLVMEDLIVVAERVLLPALFGPTTDAPWLGAVTAIGKAILFVALMMFAGARLVPMILGGVVNSRSRELFVLVALSMAMGTALASSALFGVSLALGAFVAGIVVGESPFSHQVSADLVPFREAFAVIFFVSVGMLVRPAEILARWDELLIVVLLIVVGKAVVSGGIVRALGYPARSVLIVGTGRAQIGEFSFILGQAGLAMGAIDQGQYSLILAGAIVSITVNPFVVRLVDPVERWLRGRPALWRAMDRPTAVLPTTAERLQDHVVIVGCGRVGRHIAETLRLLDVPRLVIEADPDRVDKLVELGVPVLYGEAGNSEILAHANLPHARALVITLPDDASALAVVSAAKQLAPNVHVVARASTFDGARRLRASGAGEIVRPELEGGIEIVRRTLLELNLPVREIQRYTDLVRREGLDESERPSAERASMLDELINASRSLELGWLDVTESNPMAGKRLADTSIRQRLGVTVVAVSRKGRLIPNPAPEHVFESGDRIAVVGTPAQIFLAEREFQSPSY